MTPGTVWIKSLEPGSDWVLIGTTTTGIIMQDDLLCECGHRYADHGDRAIRACAPPGDRWGATTIPCPNGCTGWRLAR